MKKLVLQYALLLLPVFAVAQSNPAFHKDFTPEIKKVVQSFKLDDHTYVMLTNIDNDNFELIAIKDNMEVLWRSKFSGYAIGAGKFEGQILAVSATGYAEKNGLLSPFVEKRYISGHYNAFLINVETGKLILQKEIYNSPTEQQQAPSFFITRDGLKFSLVIEQIDDKEATTVFGKKQNVVSSLTIVTANDKLETPTARHITPDGSFIALTYNNNADLFVFDVEPDNKTLKASKYEAGKAQSSGSILQDIDLRSKPEIDYSGCFVAPSPTDNNVAYCALTHSNPGNDHELTVTKFNFGNHSGQIINEVFDKKHVRTIEKDFVPFDKKLDKPIIGFDNEYLDVRYIEEYKGTLLVTLSEWSSDRLSAGSFASGDLSIVINGYDLNLKQKFQQVMPTHYGFYFPFSVAYHTDNTSLYVVANTASHGLVPLYGQLDLNTGSWLKMEKLEKGDFGKYDYSGYTTMWFKNGFIVPYTNLKNWASIKLIVDLAAYPY
jgi:hypothetical protein